MQGHLDITCDKCEAPYAWVKVCFTRQEDGYRDWRLVTYCACGETTDREIQEAAHEMYQRSLREGIRKGQDEILDETLGKELHQELNNLTALNPFEKKLGEIKN